MMIYLQMIDSPEDRSKFEQIYMEYRSMMFHMANRILTNEQDAEDAVHEAFLKIAENIEKIGQPKCPKTLGYIVTIVENKSIDLYRKATATKSSSWTMRCKVFRLFMKEKTPWQPGILKLPARYREVILLRYHQGYSVKEVAAMLGISHAAASKLDQRAKNRLKELYEKEGKL